MKILLRPFWVNFLGLVVFSFVAPKTGLNGFHHIKLYRWLKPCYRLDQSNWYGKIRLELYQLFHRYELRNSLVVLVADLPEVFQNESHQNNKEQWLMPELEFRLIKQLHKLSPTVLGVEHFSLKNGSSNKLVEIWILIKCFFDFPKEDRTNYTTTAPH